MMHCIIIFVSEHSSLIYIKCYTHVRDVTHFEISFHNSHVLTLHTITTMKIGKHQET